MLIVELTESSRNVITVCPNEGLNGTGEAYDKVRSGWITLTIANPVIPPLVAVMRIDWPKIFEPKIPALVMLPPLELHDTDASVKGLLN